MKLPRIPARAWVRGNAKASLLILGLFSAVVTIISWAIPGSRDWLLDHPGIGWITVALLACAFLMSIMTNDRLHAERDSVMGERAEAIRERDRLADEGSKLTAEVVRVSAELQTVTAERDQLHAEVAKRPEPTERDREQFVELMRTWHPHGDILTWLDVVFNAKQWTDKESHAFSTFITDWRYKFFDDPEVQEAFAEFYGHAQALSTWMWRHGFWDNELNRGRSDDDPVVYTVADGDEREGGWPAFDALREEALLHIGALFEQRGPLERLGRARGL